MYLGLDEQNRQIFLPAAELVTHGVVLGRTGSGKTGLLTVLMEGAVAEGASVLAIDVKGDLASLAIQPTNAADLAAFPGLDYDKHLKGLREFGLDASHIAFHRENVETTVLIVGRDVGVLPAFDSSTVESVRPNVASVLNIIGIDATSPEGVLVTLLVERAMLEGEAAPVESWPERIGTASGSMNVVGMPLDEFVPPSGRKKLARNIAAFVASNHVSGPPLNVSLLLAAPKAQVTVLSLRDTPEMERPLVVRLIIERVMEVARKIPAQTALVLMLVLDEARGFLPPYPANPASKDAILEVLAKARAQGVGLVLGTQNPMDLDYKALSNVGTWFLGRLRDRDLERDLASEIEDRGLSEKVAMLAPRQFVMLTRDGNGQVLRVRHTLTVQRGPLSEEELQRLRLGR